MTATQMNLGLAARPSGRVIPDRIRTESRDESEKRRRFEQLFADGQPLDPLLAAARRDIRVESVAVSVPSRRGDCLEASFGAGRET